MEMSHEVIASAMANELDFVFRWFTRRYLMAHGRGMAKGASRRAGHDEGSSAGRLQIPTKRFDDAPRSVGHQALLSIGGEAFLPRGTNQTNKVKKTPPPEKKKKKKKVVGAKTVLYKRFNGFSRVKKYFCVRDGGLLRRASSIAGSCLHFKLSIPIFPADSSNSDQASYTKP